MSRARSSALRRAVYSISKPSACCSDISCSATIRCRSARYVAALAALLRWTAAPASGNACFRRNTGSAAALTACFRLSTAVSAPPISDKSFGHVAPQKKSGRRSAPSNSKESRAPKRPSKAAPGQRDPMSGYSNSMDANVGEVPAGSDVARSPPFGHSGIAETDAAIGHPGRMRNQLGARPTSPSTNPAVPDGCAVSPNSRKTGRGRAWRSRDSAAPAPARRSRKTRSGRTPPRCVHRSGGSSDWIRPA